ncbi:MAG TPA: ribosome maturation factor RimP [Gammaproteobacteria bacterium]|jgi:ribosome maturation factor RimP|nr:ribosome maturation factor RimP [Gammaproteobacteria bacterium]HIK76898.1 ribosome maturation factor RimP [Gammaproteobacteria bacterium]
MNSLDSKIIEKIEKSINLIGYELMEIECSPNKRGLKIVTFIDHSDGITMDDCVKATKVITPILELKEDDDYLLEVSSPGLNRKLITKEHFDRFRGQTVKIKLKNKADDRRNFKGQLKSRNGNKVEITEDNKDILIDIDLIDICRIVPNYK